MRMHRLFTVLALLLVGSPAFAQWQTPNHSVPIGRGGGVIGFGAAVPGTAGVPAVSTGPTTDPIFGPAANAGIAPGAANTLKGSLNGTTTVDTAVPGCTSTTQALKWTAGAGFNCASIVNLTGFDMPINLGLSASSNTTALTITVTQADGTTPTPGSPVVVPFRSLTATNGAVSLGSITSTLSLTIPAGATLGTTNGVPFRVWIFLENNGGTPELGVATCSTTTAATNTATIFPCAAWENTLKTSLTISAGSTSAGTLYAPVGVANDAVRIIGYCDYASGLVAAGTWAGACTTLQVMGPGIKKPGEVVQTVSFSTTTAVSTSSASFANLAGNVITIVPIANPNPIKVTLQGTLITTGAAQVGIRWARGGATPVGNPIAVDTGAAANAVISILLYDLPAASATYQVQAKVNSFAVAFPASGIGAFFEAQEIMG